MTSKENKEMLKSLWDEIVMYIKVINNIRDIEFETWIEGWEIDNVTNNKIYLRRNQNSLDYDKTAYVERTFQRYFTDAVKAYTNTDYTIVFEPFGKNKRHQNDNGSNITLQYSFENFIAGNNAFVKRMAESIAEAPGEKYKAFWLYGNAGTGKTHLLYAITNSIAKKHPNLKVKYVTSETFEKELNDAIRLGVNLYEYVACGLDVLLIDNVDSLLGKERTQAELLYIWENMEKKGAQIIISSIEAPSQIFKLESLMLERLKKGCCVKIREYDVDTKMLIIENEIKKHNGIGNRIMFSDDVRRYIADHFKDIRLLQGMITTLCVSNRCLNKDINLYTVKRLLGDIDSSDEIMLQEIENAVNDYSQKLTEKNYEYDIGGFAWKCLSLVNDRNEVAGAYIANDCEEVLYVDCEYNIHQFYENIEYRVGVLDKICRCLFERYSLTKV